MFPSNQNTDPGKHHYALTYPVAKLINLRFAHPITHYAYELLTPVPLWWLVVLLRI